MRTILCDAVEVTEWYDGLVQGFVRHSTEISYAMLLSWDISKSKKLYLIVPISVEHHTLISAAYENSNYWPAAQKQLKLLLQTQECLLTTDEPQNGSVLNLSFPVHYAILDIDLELFRIDDAISISSRSKWLTSLQ